MGGQPRTEAQRIQKRRRDVESQRRRRAHDRGDHRLCLPENCPHETSSEVFSRLIGKRGQHDDELPWQPATARWGTITYHSQVVRDKPDICMVDTDRGETLVMRCHLCSHMITVLASEIDSFNWEEAKMHYCLRGTIVRVVWEKDV